MRVLIIINNLGIGGAERLVVDDINEMCRRGIEVHLLTLAQEPVDSFIDDVRIPDHYMHHIQFNNLISPVLWSRLISLIFGIKPNFVFTHLWQANTIGRVACLLALTKRVITFEHNIYDSVKTKKMFLIDIVLQFLSYKIVAVSTAVKDSLISHHILKEKIVVINNGIDISKYQVSKDSGLKGRIGIIDEKFVFLTIGRLIHQKGIDILIRAFSMLPTEASLLIAGEGMEERSLRKLAIDLGVADRVIFAGFRKDVPEILSFCDSFVLASRYEGLGMVILEAMAASKPIIASNFAAVKDIVEPGVNGLIVEKENVESLAESMKLMMTDAALANILGKNAYKKSLNFSIQHHVDRILSM